MYSNFYTKTKMRNKSIWTDNNKHVTQRGINCNCSSLSIQSCTFSSLYEISLTRKYIQVERIVLTDYRAVSWFNITQDCK